MDRDTHVRVPRNLCQTLRQPLTWCVPKVRPPSRVDGRLAPRLPPGPTNSGKTYNAITRLKEAGANRKPGDPPAGIFCGPLRLLALEVYEQVRRAVTAETIDGSLSARGKRPTCVFRGNGRTSPTRCDL